MEGRREGELETVMSARFSSALSMPSGSLPLWRVCIKYMQYAVRSMHNDSDSDNKSASDSDSDSSPLVGQSVSQSVSQRERIGRAWA